MTNEELDRLWFEAMHQSIEANENFVRYRFAALVAAHEREACAQVCEELRDSFLSPQYATGQPMSSIRERFAAGRCAEAIRARGEI